MPKPDHKILQNQFIIPFGRLRLKRARPTDDDPVLIGRESQRAFFVDALTGVGERGAFLITGRRGVGKSTFVENCLEDYKANVFRRFLGSGVGRSFLDIMLLIGFTLAVLGVLLTAGELLSFLAPAAATSPLLLLPMLLCIFIAGLPFIMGVRIIRNALSISFRSQVGFWTVVLVAAFVLVVLFLPPFGIPGEAIATIIAGLGFLFFSSSLVYFFEAPIPLGFFRYHNGTWSFVKPDTYRWQIFCLNFLGAACLVVVGIFLAQWLSFRPGVFNGEILEGSKRHFCVGAIGVAWILGTIIGNSGATRLITEQKRNQLPDEEHLGGLILRKTALVIWFGFMLFLIAGIAAPILTGTSAFWSVAAFVLSILLVRWMRAAAYLRKADLPRSSLTDYWPLRFFRALHWMFQSDRKDRPNVKEAPPRFFAPPVEAMLVLKGLAFILVSIQMLFPLIGPSMSSGSVGDRVLIDQHFSEIGEETNRILCIDNAWFLVACDHPSELSLVVDPDAPTNGLSYAFESPLIVSTNQEALAQQAIDALQIYSAMFQDTHMAVGWFVAAFLLIICLFLVEYEWINRPFVNQRQPRALDRAPRRPQQIHHHLDPVWLEVSAKRQWDAAVRDAENTNRKKPEPFGAYYEKASPGDKANELFIRRNNLQRRALRRFRSMEAQTFTHAITQLWLPVVEVNVNLGFDALDHRGVTHAMLDGLRRSYRRKFVSLQSSPYAVLRALGLTLVVTIGVVQLGEAWFDMPSHPAHQGIWLSEQKPSENNRYDAICDYLSAVRGSDEVQSGEVSMPLGADLLCQTYTPIATALLELLYSEIVPFELRAPYNLHENGQTETDLAFWFTHRNQAPPFAGETWENSLAVRGYHFALAILLFGLIERIGRRFPIIPYRKNLERIGALLDDLTLRRADSRNARAGVGVGSLFELSRGTETSREALDPRSVELKLLSLLNDLRGKPSYQDRGRWTNITIPMPDIHFVFDELDKLSGIVSPDLGTSDSVEQDREALDSERQRAYRLRSLLSDMKRVISSAPARFIFVGGRTLHDEWVRDQNRLGTTQPLLTSIFDHETYLPSLLVDFSAARFSNALYTSDTQPQRALDLRIREYVISAYHSAKTFQETLKNSRYVPFIGLPPMVSTAQKFRESIAPPRDDFAAFTLIDARQRQPLPSSVRGAEDEKESEIFIELQKVWKQEFFHIFIGFLAYRSAGSPKKLNELLAELVRPSGALMHPEMDGNVMVPASQDSLVINEKELYRMQLINSLFRHIEASFGTDLLERDDKITINTIFMFDFLMKMHNRAFSWSSIERLDELAHIHRAPDLRRLFDSVISNSAERYFHRVLNGLFTFRFRSELATEIRYLSRVSQTEMAALNFTLDESQELKATFTRMLENTGDANPDLMIALGELYEFDQAYDIARDHYERATRAIDHEFIRLNGAELGADNKLQQAVDGALEGTFLLRPLHGYNARDLVTSERPGPPDDPFMHAMLSDTGASRDALRLNLPWAIRRLRLMLQIGLTYEQQADEERAQAQYHSAQLFASFLLNAALASEDKEAAPLSHVIKHLPLIFQPVFASAWVAEKLENGVDTSLSIVEREIRQLHENLPFVNDPGATENEEATQNMVAEKRDARSNHLVAMAEIRNKAGDFTFFKGRAAYDIKNDGFPALATWAEGRDGSGTEGYLFRAHYHYAMSLHQMRRFVFYRRQANRTRLALAVEGSKPGSLPKALGKEWHPLDRKNLPTFVYQTVASSMVDVAEVTLARSSLLEAWAELSVPHKAKVCGKDADIAQVGEILRAPFDIHERLQELGGNDTKTSKRDAYARKLFDKMRGALDGWFDLSDEKTRKADSEAAEVVRDYLGEWQKGDTDKLRENRLKFGKVKGNHNRLVISLLLSLYGGRAINRANYPDAASFESQITAEHVVRLLRSARGLLSVAHVDPNDQTKRSEKRQKCADVVTLNTEQLDLISTLIEIGILALDRLAELKRLAYPERADEKKSGKGYQTTDTSEIVAAALATSMRNIISNLSGLVAAPHKEILDEIEERESLFDQQDYASKLTAEFEVKRLAAQLERLAALPKYLKHWQHAMDALATQTASFLNKGLLEHVHIYDALNGSKVSAGSWHFHRQQSRALLIYLVTHHRYPMLTNLTMLKALIDDVSVVDGLDLGAAGSEHREERIDEAKKWFRELIEGEKLLDAPMHYPPCHIAETASLLALTCKGELAEGVSRRFRWKAEQSFTMGRQYYQNISRLIYLFDDFNDRRRHSNHAGQMGMADMLALYRYIFDDRT